MFEFRDLFQWDRYCTDTAKRPYFIGPLEGFSLIVGGG